MKSDGEHDTVQEPKLTFMPLIASVTLGTALVAITPLVLITRPANRETTMVTCHEHLPILH